MTIRQLQRENALWAKNNFQDSCNVPHRPLLGLVEEIGELGDEINGLGNAMVTELARAVGRIAHSRLKREQSIRIGEDHIKAAQDAIADIMIFLVHYCETEGWDCDDIVTKVWAEVKCRDWTKDKVNAGIGTADVNLMDAYMANPGGGRGPDGELLDNEDQVQWHKDDLSEVESGD